MQDKLISIATHITVAVVSATVTYFIQRRVYKQQTAIEIKQIKDAYKKRDLERQNSITELKKAESFDDLLTEQPDEIEAIHKISTDEKIIDDVISKMGGAPDASVAPIKQSPTYVDYTRNANMGRIDKLDEGTEPYHMDLAVEWRTAMNPSPDKAYVISDSQYQLEQPDYNKVELTYFCQDQVMVDEVEDIIDVGVAYVPDNFDSLFGCESGDIDLLYTRNDKLKTDVQIRRLWVLYEDIISGISDEETYEL